MTTSRCQECGKLIGARDSLCWTCATSKVGKGATSKVGKGQSLHQPQVAPIYLTKERTRELVSQALAITQTEAGKRTLIPTERELAESGRIDLALIAIRDRLNISHAHAVEVYREWKASQASPEY